LIYYDKEQDIRQLFLLLLLSRESKSHYYRSDIVLENAGKFIWKPILMVKDLAFFMLKIQIN